MTDSPLVCDILGCEGKPVWEYSDLEYRITWRYCKKHYRHHQKIYEYLIE